MSGHDSRVIDPQDYDDLRDDRDALRSLVEELRAERATAEAGLRLFHVKDRDRPMFVVARTFADALDRYKAKIREENDGDDCEPPLGIDYVCDEHELLLPGGK